MIVGVAAALATIGGLSYAATDTASSSCNQTPNADGTITCTIQATVDVTPPTLPGPTTTETAPGPTTTVTETQTVTQTVTANPNPPPSSTTPPPPPPPPTTTTPPPPGPFAPGESLNATNTGYAAAGSACPSGLAPSGAVTYSASGTAAAPIVVSCVAYVGEVDVEGSYVTIEDCSLTNGGLNSIGFLLNGNHDTVRDCTITSPTGESMYEPIWIFHDSNTVDGVNISRGENALTTYGTHVLIENSYLHDAALDSNPGDHPDSIEVYGGCNTGSTALGCTATILDNRIVEACGSCAYSGQPGMFDSPINVAPYNSYKVEGLTIQGNFLDNGQGDTLIDNQNTSCNGGNAPATGNCLTDVKVVDNAFGGHQCPATNQFCIGVFTDLENYERRPFVADDAGLAANPNAIEWPTTGPDVNRWEENDGTWDEASSTLRDGDVVVGSPN